MKNKKIKSIISLLVLFGLIIIPFFNNPKVANAASLSSLSDLQSTVKKNTASNHEISFVTPTGVGSSGVITITFPADYSIPAALDYTDIDLQDDTVDVTLDASQSGSTWGVVRNSSTELIFTNGNSVVAGGSVINIKIGTNATHQSTGVRQITNPTTAGSFVINIAGGFGDTGSITTVIVDDDTVAISATVAQGLTFSISSNSITFGTLSSSAARYADASSGSNSDTVAHTISVGTNGGSGYAITIKGPTLTSGVNTITANGATAAASSAGTEQFGIYATKSGGVNATIDATFSDDATPAFGYDGTSSTAVPFAAGTTATSTTTYSLHYIANIAPNTEAGSYATNLIYVATANF